MKRGSPESSPSLRAQARHVDVQRLRGAEPVHVPDLVDEPLARHHRAGLAHQQLEQLELAPREVELGSPPSVTLRRSRVEPQLAHLERPLARRRRRGAAAQHRPDARHHLAGAERLDHVVVGPELEAHHAVGLLPARREHDDRHLGVAPQLATDVVARAVRQHHVQQHQVGRAAARLLERRRHGAGDRACRSPRAPAPRPAAR